jgi:hypothetical protein
MHEDSGLRIWAPAFSLAAGLAIFALMVFAATHSGEQAAPGTAQTQLKPGANSPAANVAAPKGEVKPQELQQPAENNSQQRPETTGNAQGQ